MVDHWVLVRRQAGKGTWTSETVTVEEASSLSFGSPSMGPSRVVFLAGLDHEPSAAEIDAVAGGFDDEAEVALLEQRSRDAAAALKAAADDDAEAEPDPA